MRISGVSNFHVPTINNRLDLNNLKCAEVEVGYIPEPSQNNVYVSAGRLGETYSNKSIKENMENFFKIMRNLEIREPDWEYKTITLSTSEIYQVKYDSLSKHSKMLKEMKTIDIQI